MTIRRILSCALLAALCLPASAEPGELFPDAKGTKPSPSTPGKSAPAFPATPKLTGVQAAAAAAQARKMVQDFSAKAKLRIQETASDRFLFFSDLPAKETDPIRKSLEAAAVATIQKLAIPYAEPPFGGKLAVIVLANQSSLPALATRNDITLADDAIAYVATNADRTPAHIALVLAANVREKDDAKKGWQQMARSQVAEAILSRHVNARPLPAWVERGFVGYVGDESAAAPAAVEGDVPLAEILKDPARHTEACESVVAFLQRRDAKAFAEFIRALKNGARESDALQKTFKLDRQALESAWRQHVADRRGS